MIEMINLKTMRWARHEENMGRRRIRIGFWWEGQKDKYH
jgi:hypothetical protein